MSWRVTTKEVIREKTPMVEVSLSYDGNLVKQCVSQLHGYEVAVIKTFEVEAASYNRLGWEPTFDPWIMSGARILNDSLNEVNGRRVDYPYRNPAWEVSLCCTGAAQFWFNGRGECTFFTSPEITYKLEKYEERMAFLELIDRELLNEQLGKAHAVAPEKEKKAKATSREERMAAEQDKLNKWKEGK